MRGVWKCERGEVHRDLLVSVALNEHEVPGLPPLQQAYMEECHYHRCTYSQMDQQQFCAVKSLNRNLSDVSTKEANYVDCLEVRILISVG